MLFNKREREVEQDVIGEARVVDPSEDITVTRDDMIDAVAEPQLVTMTAVIGQSIVIRGDVSGDEDLLVEGRIEGTVALPKSRLVIGANGNVAADVNAKTLRVEGTMTGDIAALDSVVVKSTGKMHGNIKAPRITLEDGCRFNGTINMDTEASAVVTDLKTPSPSVKTTSEKQAV